MTNEKYPIETWKYEDWKNNFKTKKEFDKFVKEAKKNNSKLILVSAKISKRSHNRFSKILFSSKILFLKAK